VAAGAVGGLQTDQARVLGSRTLDRNQRKRQGCGSCPSCNPIVGDYPHTLSLVEISTALILRRPNISGAQSTCLLRGIQTATFFPRRDASGGNTDRAYDGVGSRFRSS
jgi:hypothetical protein